MPATGPGDKPNRPRRRPRERKHQASKRPPAPRPSSQNAQAYVSQGRAVAHVAHQQQRAARPRAAEVKDTKGAADLGRAKAFKRRPRYVRDVEAARVAGFTASPQYKHAPGKFGVFSSLLHVANSPAAKLSTADRDAIGAMTFAGPAADIPRTRSELARSHSFASLLLHEGQHVIAVARQLGHDARLTLTRYGHVLDELSGAGHIDPEAEIRAARDALVPAEYPQAAAVGV